MQTFSYPSRVNVITAGQVFDPDQLLFSNLLSFILWASYHFSTVTSSFFQLGAPAISVEQNRASDAEDRSAVMDSSVLENRYDTLMEYVPEEVIQESRSPYSTRPLPVFVSEECADLMKLKQALQRLLFATFSHPSGKVATRSVDEATTLRRRFVSVIFDAFNERATPTSDHRKAREKLLVSGSLLQFIVLELVCYLTHVSEQGHAALRDTEYLKFLLGPYFFRFQSVGVVAEEYLSRLRRSVMEAIGFSLMIARDNAAECEGILAFLRNVAPVPPAYGVRYDGELLADCFVALQSAIRFNRTVTVAAVMANSAVPYFLDLAVELDKQLQVLFESARGLQGRVEQEVMWSTLIRVLSVVDYVLAQDKNRAQILCNPSAVSSLFHCIFRRPLRQFAMQHVCSLMRLRKIDEDAHPSFADAKQGMFKKYVECFSQAFQEIISAKNERERERTMHLIVTLLEGIVTVARGIKENQILFRDCECFIQMASLLNMPDPASDGTLLSIQIVRAMTALMVGNKAVVAFVRENIGFRRIGKLIKMASCHSHTPSVPSLLLSRLESTTADLDTSLSLSPSRTDPTPPLDPSTAPFLPTAVIDALFDMMFESDGSTPLRDPRVKIAEVSNMIVQLAPTCSLTTQQFVTDRLCQILKSSSANRAACCAVNVTSYVLRWLSETRVDGLESMIVQSNLVKLFEYLGSHSITVKELKRFFKLMQCPDVNFRPAIWPLLIKTMQQMAVSNNPLSCFDFDGVESGIFLPRQRWPKGGFSISTWLHIDPNAGPRLALFFFGGAEKGVCIFLTRDSDGFYDPNIVVYAGGKQEQHILNLRITASKWIHLVISQNAPRSIFSGRSDVVASIGGISTVLPNIRYVTTSVLLEQCCIGMLPSDKEFLVDTSPYCGQLSTVYFFDTCIGSKAVKILHELGPAYSRSFGSGDVVREVLGDMAELRNSLSFAYSPQASFRDDDENVVLQDISSDASARSSRLAKVSGHLRCCVARSIKDMLQCLGGIVALFPLLWQLDLPEIQVSEGQERTSFEAPVWVFQILQQMLDRNLVNQQIMMEKKGFAVIAFLMKRCAPENLNENTLLAIQKLVLSIPVEGATKELFTEAARSLLFDFDLWIYASEQVQLLLVKSLLPSIYNHGSSALQDQHDLGFLHLLRVLNQYYWYSFDKETSRGMEKRQSSPVGDIVFRRPSESAISAIRSAIIALMIALVRGCPSEAQVCAMLCSMLSTEDQQQVTELLLLFREFMTSNPIDLNNSLQSIAATPVSAFLTLFCHPYEPVQMASLAIIGHILCLPSGSQHAAGTAAILATLFRTSSLSDEGLQSMATMFLEGVTMDSAEPNPALLTILIEVIPSLSERQRLVVLQNMASAFSQSPRFAAVMSETPRWLKCLVRVLFDSPSPEREDIVSIVLSILTQVTTHLLTTHQFGWKFVEDTILELVLAQRSVCRYCHPI